MKTNELYLKTLFCCCACDGEIAQEEVDMIKELTENSTLFQEIQVEYSINEYVNQINSQGKAFLKDYLSELSNTVLSDDEQITLIDLAIKMIEADKQVLYSEVKFFKKIRSRITVSDEQILLKLSGIEDYYNLTFALKIKISKMLEDLNKYLSNNMGECKPLIQVQTCATKRVDREIHHSVVGRCRGRN